MSPPAPSRREWWTVAGIALALALLLTLPVVLTPWARVIGAERSDVWAHLWGYWRTEQALLVHGRFPLAEPALNHPWGGDLYHVDLLNSLLSLPLGLVLGRAMAFNLVVWLQLVLATTVTWRLARELRVGQLPALLAGLAFGYGPYVLGFAVASGVSERLNVAWLPLFLWAMLRLARGGGQRWVGVGAAAFLLAVLGCWKFGLFVFMLAGLFSLFLLVRPLFLRGFHPQELGGSLIGAYRDLILLRLLPLALACALIVAPLAWMAAGSSHDEGGMMPRSTPLFWDGQADLGAPDGRLLHETDLFTAVDLVRPFAQGKVTTEKDWLFQSIYSGLSLVVLALGSLVARRRFARFFLPAALFFGILALGPRIELWPGAPSMLSPLFFATARVVPFFTAMHTPWEYALLAALCLAMAGALGLDWLLAKLPPGLGRRLGPALLVLVVLDLGAGSGLPLPLPSARVHIPPLYEALAEEPGRFALLDYPMRRPGSRLVPETYYLYQTVHRRPIPYGINACWLETLPFWHQLGQLSDGERASYTPSPRELEDARAMLAEMGLRYVLLHREVADPERLPALEAFFTGWLGEPSRSEGGISVYRVPGALEIGQQPPPSPQRAAPR
jgi:hypothetical protein